MRKGKALRLAGFVTAACATTALVATAAQSTGAWFTDSHTGTISSSSGHLNLLIKNAAGVYKDADTSQMNLAYSDLMAGEDKDQTVDYQVTASSGNMDLWLTFDSDSANYGMFTGNKPADYNGYTGGGLGGYGHFKVVGNAGYSFESYNLQLPPTNTAGDYGAGYYKSGNGVVCSIDGNGDGGEHAGAIGPDNGSQAAPECGAPAAIKLASNLPSGYKGAVTVTFGLTGKQTQQGQTEPTVTYHLVATQAGHAPSAENF